MIVEDIGLTSNKYQIIYADPAWKYKDTASAGNRGACHKYDVMNLEDICNLPVARLAAENCLLAMWWVVPRIELFARNESPGWDVFGNEVRTLEVVA